MKKFVGFVALVGFIGFLLPSQVKAVSCGLSDNATNTLNTACVIDGAPFTEGGTSYYSGIANGDMVVSGADVTVSPGVTMTWSPGKAIMIQNGGRIIRGANAILKQVDPMAWFRQQLGFDTYAAGVPVKILGQNLHVCTADPCTVTGPSGGGSLIVENSIKFGDSTTQTTAYTGGGETSGQIAFFAAACPSGWTEYTAARGMYIVGNPLSGTLATAVGTALTNLENRPTGVHSHNITDPGHSHTIQRTGGGAVGNAVADGGYTNFENRNGVVVTGGTGITVNNYSGVSGTNAPYIQLTACQKN